jgi:hypothetical protein
MGKLIRWAMCPRNWDSRKDVGTDIFENCGEKYSPH